MAILLGWLKKLKRNIDTSKNGELMSFKNPAINANLSPEVEGNIENLVFKFFRTTIDLELNDGSFIRKGTEFLVESVFEDGLLELHFCMDKNNHYKNECGDGYLCTLQQLKSFSDFDDEKQNNIREAISYFTALLDRLGNGDVDNLICVTALAALREQESRMMCGEWERMENPWGKLEGFMCGCGYQSNAASPYCSNCGQKMSGGEQIECSLKSI